MTPMDRCAAAQRINKAEGVLDGLREAFAVAGIVLPSLRLHPATWSDEAGGVLIDLGACNLDTARRLVNVLRTARPEESTR